MENTETKILAALEAEVSKAKHRLNLTNSDRENMEKSIVIIKNDTQAAQKHHEYLLDLNVQKQKEIDTKQSVIMDLDIQKGDKQGNIERLQQQTNLLSSEIAEKLSIVEDLDKKISAHNEYLTVTREAISKAHKEANDKHILADEKIEKIKRFLKEI